ncbi:TadE/TadG family type IV pilus assembly protein [Sanguibacter massiliensis]|uniref:TadE/TadG family type IV pilus assembly protein n=1 Tax=Sanguibacter massiliensis TaxID=1973217 RepID=UPI000C8296E2|nr:hypothetical protein [Sanguibacter massiliensis]
MSRALSRALRRGARDDRGSVAVESIGFFFVLTLVTFVCVQGVFLAQSVSTSQKLARDAARSYAVGQGSASVAQQVHDDLPSWATLEDVRFPTSADARVEVELRVPILVPGFTNQSFTVSRDAVMPRS